VDTAGLRKKSKEMEDVEFYSVTRSIRAIENADVCLLLLDATRGLESQDMSILRLIQSNRKGLVILVNKWDLIEKETNTSKAFEENIKGKIAPFTDVPIIFMSALTKQRIHKVLEVAMEVNENRIRKISTPVLNDTLLPMIESYPPPSWKGKHIKVKYCTQLPTHTPSFVLFCNLPQYIKENYKRYLENRMREKWNFSGVPIQLFFRKK
jgi:GTP-binding protein